MESSPPPPASRIHILCVSGPAGLAAPAFVALRARFGSTHSIELLSEPGDVTAVVRTLHRAGRRAGDEVEVIVAEAGADTATEANLLRTNWPAARWVLLEDRRSAAERDAAPEGTPLPSELEEALAAQTRAAIQEYRQHRRDDLNAALARMELLRDLPPDRLAWIADRVELRRYEAGEVVVRAGEAGDGVYFIRSGEVKVLDVERTGQERIIARRGRGEHFGEMALITGEPRSNTVVTDLDSELFFVRKQHYDQLIGAEPGLSLHLSRVLSTRLARAQHRHRDTPRIIAFFGALPDAAGGGAALGLARAIATETERAAVLLELEAPRSSRGAHLERILDTLGRSAAVKREDCAELEPRLWGLAAQRAETLRRFQPPPVVPELFDLLIAAFDFVIVAIGPETPPDVIVRVVKQCDVLLLHAGRGVEDARAARELLALMHRECPSAESKLVVAAEPEAGTGPADPGALLGRPATRRLPSTTSGPLDVRAYRRLARWLVGIGVGLSLGGGGARGAAHLGVVDVLEKEGIPIDLVSGTSAGSIVGAGYAMERTMEEGIGIWKEETRINPIRRYAFSKTSIFSGRGLEGLLRRLYGDARIEDLPIPFVAIATDLEKAAAVPIDHGPVWLAVRASCSMPGVISPVRMGDTYLVDGGVTDNVPADVLRSRGARFVIAVDITPRRGFDVGGKARGERGWMGRSLRRIGPIREFLDAPSMLQVIMRAMEVQGLQSINSRAWSWNICIHPDVSGFSILDFAGNDALIARGREAAAASIPDIKAGLRTLLDAL